MGDRMGQRRWLARRLWLVRHHWLARYMRAWTAWAGLVFGIALIGPGGAAARAPSLPEPPVLLAEQPKGFDDYTPPPKTEQLPREGGQGGQGGATTGGGGTTTGGGGTTTGQGGATTGGSSGGSLSHRHILGTWCSTTSSYIIGRTRLTVILTDSGTRSNYRVFGFHFTDSTVAVRWISGENKRVRTTFGRFSADNRRMVQLAPNRPYERCVLPGAKQLGYSDILGSWCDADSRYIITRTQLTVVFSSGRRVTYRITGFRFLKDTIDMNWTNSAGAASRTRFGRYSANRRTMVQFGANRTYRRC